MFSITTKPTEETRQKMSEVKKGKESTFKGKSQPESAKLKISISSKKSWENEETKKKMRNKGNSIEILDMNMNRIGILNGNYEMKEKGFNLSCVHKVISGKYSQYKGYIFRKLLEKQESYLDITVV